MRLWFSRSAKAIAAAPPEPKRWDGRYRIDRHIRRNGEEYFKVHFMSLEGCAMEVMKQFPTLQDAESHIEKRFAHEVVCVEENIAALPNLKAGEPSSELQSSQDVIEQKNKAGGDGK